MPKLMKCGHIANAIMLNKTDKKYIDCCAICDCIDVDREVTGTELLTGRMAKCEYCGYFTPSNWNLPFFKHNPTLDYDSYYCGCRGWD